jgi:2-polyprenyl-3-methyl-5-hydroxy-6-metoxy-1,4-benzoquinol methylase
MGEHGVELNALEDDPEGAAVAEAVGAVTTVLDCGCGGGRVARRLATGVVDGIELSGDAAQRARSVCRTVVHGSVTDSASWRALGAPQYQAIVFCHVLEHLTEPLVALKLACESLSPGGHLVIVLPNVATWRMRLHLLAGRWDYADEGILDRTHVKFYTLKSARELLADAHLRIRKEQLLVMPPAGGALRRLLVRGVRKLSSVATTQAFLFVAVPMDA